MQLSKINTQPANTYNRQNVNSPQKTNYSPSFGKITPKLTEYFNWHFRELEQTFGIKPLKELRKALEDSSFLVGIDSISTRITDCNCYYNFAVGHPEFDVVTLVKKPGELQLRTSAEGKLTELDRVKQHLEEARKLLTGDTYKQELESRRAPKGNPVEIEQDFMRNY